MTTQSKLRKRLATSARQAFSLVELLVVIAVIGIIAAIAIPNISGITASAQTARDQRNAQNIASVASAARAAGYSFSGAATGTAAVTALIGSVTSNGATFKLDMDPADYTAAVKGFLNYAPATGFAYVKAGGGTAD
ncbi:MAG: prepilin-type N-terminal cleavage/methylation domain-containing protein [Terrimicrobiaceae bacterium]|nr:prepilin-type N-terminal cleavage/methylation domain-containing protein [Terrimicrobiaceae bacterium]